MPYGTYGPRWVHNPGSEPEQVELTAEEIAAREAKRQLALIRRANRETREAAKITARAALRNFDYQTAKDILEGETIPNAAKVVLKQVFDLVKAIRTATIDED